MPLDTMPRRARCLTVVALLVTVGFPSGELFGMSANPMDDPLRVHATPRRAPTGPLTATQDDSMSVFVRTHVALQALRDRVQAELAEPKNKKDEEQQALREKLRTERARLLREHGMTEERFARMTRWVSVDDSARKVFDALVAKAGSKGA